MKITALGTGGMYTLSSFHTNFLVQSDWKSNRYMLVDCGSDIRLSMAALGVRFDNIAAVYITHEHPDHAGGLAYLAYASISRPEGAPKIKLYCVSGLVDRLWRQLEPHCYVFGGCRRTLQSYFDIVTVDAADCALWEGVKITPTAWCHVRGHSTRVNDRLEFGLRSYGVTLEHGGIKIHYTGDTAPQAVPHIGQYIAHNDIALAFVDCDTSSTEYPDPVHPKLSDWGKLPETIKSRLRLVHYGDDVMIKGGPHPAITLSAQAAAAQEGLMFMSIHDTYDTDKIRAALEARGSEEPTNGRSRSGSDGGGSGTDGGGRGTGTGECTCGRCGSGSPG